MAVVIHAVKRVPHQGFVGIVYAYAIVDDTDLYVLWQLADGHIDLAAFGRVTHGIFNQVLQQGLKIQAAQCEFDVHQFGHAQIYVFFQRQGQTLLQHQTHFFFQMQIGRLLLGQNFFAARQSQQLQHQIPLPCQAGL